MTDPEDSLFSQQQHSSTADGQLPWWQRNFLLQQPTLVEAWNGVFPTVIVNIFGIVIFLRMGWIVGTAGVFQAILILALCTLFSGVTVLSAIGICERCQIKSGGIYFLVSHVLGKRTGGAVGVIFIFGQATSTSLVALGFGESMSKLFGVFNPSTIKVIAIAVLVVLTALNFAGLRFIIRLQLLLLCFLGVAILDFLLGGLFFTHDPQHGIGELSGERLGLNWVSNYNSVNCTPIEADDDRVDSIFQTKNESFFSVFGVLFANFIGVLAGVNMSGNLVNPLKNIADGELSALGISFVLCALFILVLGGSCSRVALLCDSMISERISLTKLFFLGGLYISCLSSILGSTLGTSRVVSGIASEGLIPFLSTIVKEDSPNKNPIKATILVTAFAALFTVLGDLNQLAILSAIPFLVTYAFVNYSYVSLAMSHDLDHLNQEVGGKPGQNYGSMQGIAGGSGVPHSVGGGPSAMASQQTLLEGLFHSSDGTDNELTDPQLDRPLDAWEPIPQKAWYSRYINRYISFTAAIVDVTVVIFINKWFAFFHLLAFVFLYLYLGKTCPSSDQGISNFSIRHMLRVALGKDFQTTFFAYNNAPVSIVPGSQLINSADMQTTQLNEANQDFAQRKQYHHSEMVG